MTAPHYYASTSGILVDRFLKYGMFPFVYGGGLAITKDHDRATKWAQMICLAASATITTTFLGLESDMIDVTARDAVSAEMGIDPSKVQFSDYKHSGNTIARKAYSDLMRLQWGRYGTDLLFALPSLIEIGYGKFTGEMMPPTKKVVASNDPRSGDYDPNKYSGFVKLLQGHVGWAMSPYAGKAAYWTYETYKVPKTGYYEVVKFRENTESTGKDIKADDLKSIYQRTRTDQKLPMVGLRSREENDALRELFTRMAEEYNKHDGKFGISEIIYLIGGNKINIHAADKKTFSKEAVEQSNREIDKVLAIGLSGIREENRKRHAEERRLGGDTGSLLEGGIVNANTPANGKKSFVDRFTNVTTSAIRDVLTTVNMIPKRPEEYLSPRDPTNLTSGNSMISR